MDGRSEVVEKAGQRQRKRARRAPRSWLSLEYIDIETCLRQNNGCRQAIGASADHARFTAHYKTLRMSPHDGTSRAISTRYSRGATVGISTAPILPSASRSSVGAYRPRISRRHHAPEICFSASVVNQYCHRTARTRLGGPCGKGLPANSASTSLSPDNSRTSVLSTRGYSLHAPNDANHRFQSKRG